MHMSSYDECAHPYPCTSCCGPAVQPRHHPILLGWLQLLVHGTVGTPLFVINACANAVLSGKPDGLPPSAHRSQGPAASLTAPRGVRSACRVRCGQQFHFGELRHGVMAAAAAAANGAPGLGCRGDSSVGSSTGMCAFPLGHPWLLVL